MNTTDKIIQQTEKITAIGYTLKQLATDISFEDRELALTIAEALDHLILANTRILNHLESNLAA